MLLLELGIDSQSRNWPFLFKLKTIHAHHDRILRLVEQGGLLGQAAEVLRWYDWLKSQGVDGALGIVQGEHALGRIEFDRESLQRRKDEDEDEAAE